MRRRREKKARRKRVVKKRQTLALGSEPLRASVTRAAGSPSPDVLLAEGDSWFDYPFHDVLKVLEDDHGYDIESVAHKGDAVEQMAYGAGQLDDFTRLLEKLIRAGRPPKAILLSGGGNDVAGVEFTMMLNHSSVSGLRVEQKGSRRSDRRETQAGSHVYHRCCHCGV